MNAIPRRRWTDWENWTDDRAEMHVKVIEFKAKKLRREQIERDQKEREAQLAELKSNRELAQSSDIVNSGRLREVANRYFNQGFRAGAIAASVLFGVIWSIVRMLQ